MGAENAKIESAEKVPKRVDTLSATDRGTCIRISAGMVQLQAEIIIHSLLISKISVKHKLAEEKTMNKNFFWHGPVLRNNSYSQSFHQENLSKAKVS